MRWFRAAPYSRLARVCFPTGTVHAFAHPYFQTLPLFFGETLCLLAYYLVFRDKADADKPQGYSTFVFMIPASIDFVVCSMERTALLLTYASTFAMLRGSLVVYTGTGFFGLSLGAVSRPV